MNLSLVPLSEKDSAKIKTALNTSPELDKLRECIEAELEFHKRKVTDDLIGVTVTGNAPNADLRLAALHVMRLEATLGVLEESLEPGFVLQTLDIDK